MIQTRRPDCYCLWLHLDGAREESSMEHRLKRFWPQTVTERCVWNLYDSALALRPLDLGTCFNAVLPLETLIMKSTGLRVQRTGASVEWLETCWCWLHLQRERGHTSPLEDALNGARGHLRWEKLKLTRNTVEVWQRHGVCGSSCLEWHISSTFRITSSAQMKASYGSKYLPQPTKSFGFSYHHVPLKNKVLILFLSSQSFFDSTLVGG